MRGSEDSQKLEDDSCPTARDVMVYKPNQPQNGPAKLPPKEPSFFL